MAELHPADMAANFIEDIVSHAVAEEIDGVDLQRYSPSVVAGRRYVAAKLGYGQVMLIQIDIMTEQETSFYRD